MPTPADLASHTATELAAAGLDLLVEHDDERLLVSGIVMTAEEREAALDIARSIAGRQLQVDESIEVAGALPDEQSGADLSETEVAGFTGATPGLEDPESAHPGDFTDQPSLTREDEAQPATLSDTGEPMGLDPSGTPAEEDGETYVPPIDPVGTNDEIVGGYSRSSMDEMAPERSSDGTYGDEAILEAVARELREDAATAGLEVTVEVTNGIVRLSGRVPDLVDAENAEEVAARVDGVLEVREELDVEGLEREHDRR